MNEAVTPYPDMPRISGPDPSIAANDDQGPKVEAVQEQIADQPRDHTAAAGIGRRARPRPNSWVPNSWGDPF